MSPRLLAPWAALVILTLLVAIGLGAQEPDYPTPFAVAHAYRLLVGAELFFILILAPLLAHGRGGAPPPGPLDLALGLAGGAPAAIVAGWVSDCPWGQVAASQGYLLAAALLAAACLRADRDGRLLAWYWLALAAVGAGAPAVAFVAEDLLAAEVGWLYALSPFWVADSLCRPERAAWGLAIPSAAALVLLAAATFALSHRQLLSRRPT